MRAAVLFDRNDLRVTDWPDPALEPGDVLVRVARCGVCGSDLRTYFRGPSPRYCLPAILGHEFVGTVAEVGENATGYQRGERVAAAPAVPCGECFYCKRGEDNLCRNLLDFGINFDGAFAELIRVPARLIARGGLVKLTDALPDDLAIWGEPVGTVLHAQLRSHVGAEPTVTIIGDGPMGLLHTLVAKELGAAQVSVIGHHAERLEIARRVGADWATRDTAKIKSQLGDRGADIVIVAVSQGDALVGAFDLVRDGGTIVAFGGSSRDAKIGISPYRLHYGEVTLTGAFNCTTDDFKRALDMIPRLNLAPLAPHVVPLEAIVEGFRAVYAREVVKVVVGVSSKM